MQDNVETQSAAPSAQSQTPPPSGKREWPHTGYMEAKLPGEKKATVSTARESTIATKVQEAIGHVTPADYDGILRDHRLIYDLLHGKYGPISPEINRLLAARKSLIEKAYSALQNGNARPVQPGPGQIHVSGPKPGRSAERAARLAKNKAALQTHDEIVTILQAQAATSAQTESATPPDAVADAALQIRDEIGAATTPDEIIPATDEAEMRCQTYFSMMSVIPERDVPPFIKWLIRQETVSMSIADLRLTLCRYQVKYLSLWGTVHFKDRIEELRGDIPLATDIEEIKALQSELSMLILPTAESAAHATANLLHGEWAKCEQFIDLLLMACEMELTMEKEKLEQCEGLLFENHVTGLTRQPTSASKAIDDVITQIQGFRDKKKNQIARSFTLSVPDGEQTVLNWLFGLSILG